MAFWSENVGVFSCHKLFRTRFCCTSTRALSFGLIYLQTMRQACCWQVDMFGVTCHPVLLQVLIYHDVLLSVSSNSNPSLSNMFCQRFCVNLFFPRFLTVYQKEKKSLSFLPSVSLTLLQFGHFHRRRWYLNIYRKNGRKVQKVDSHPPPKKIPFPWNLQ